MVGASLNFGYNMMLTAAHDLLTPHDSPAEFCNPMSAGTFLVADTIGGVAGISMAPLVPVRTDFKMAMVTIVSLCSFVVAAFSHSELASLTSVVMAAFAAGFGETTILSLSLKYHQRVLSAYTSGLGASAILSSGAYLIATSFLSIKQSLLVMLVVPIIMCIAFWLIIGKPEEIATNETASCQKGIAVDAEPITPIRGKAFRLLLLTPHTILPIFMTSVLRSFMNQGLFELIYDPAVGISAEVQYRVYNAICNLGMFISQSSVQCVQIKKLWFLPLIEAAVMALVLLQILSQTPSLYLTVLLSLMGGLVGGAVIVNTYYRVRKETPSDLQSAHMGIAICANELGAAVAGFSAVPSHAAICSFISTSIPSSRNKITLLSNVVYRKVVTYD